MKWKRGDMALIVPGGDGHDELAGRTCELVRFIGSHDPDKPYYYEDLPDNMVIECAWQVSMSGCSLYAVSESCLQPIDGYDGNELTTWDKCIWQPERDLVSLGLNRE